MKNALLVEDHDDTAQWMTEVVTKSFPSIQVTLVATIEDAIKALKSRPFNLALVDLNLPDGSGISVISHITRHCNTTYSVVTTIFDDDEHVFEALRAGAKGYLLKDKSEKRIIRQLQGITSGEPPLTPVIANRILQYFSSLQNREEKIQEGVCMLSPRETEVLILAAKGLSRPEISKYLKIKPSTTASNLKNIYQKLNISSRAEAAAEAIRLGLI